MTRVIPHLTDRIHTRHLTQYHSVYTGMIMVEYVNFTLTFSLSYRNQVWVRVLSRQNLARVIQTGHLLHEA